MMDPIALMLSRIQFAGTVSFHIIFPAFTIGLAAWLCVLEIRFLATGQAVYRRLFDFWRSIFAVAFGMGVVSGIVMAFEFGTNWSELARRTGSIQGPLLLYESFTAFALEASFFGVVMFGRERVPKWFYLFACIMVAAGTTLSSYWILVNNSWMQWPVGYEMLPSGDFQPTDWHAILFSYVVWIRFPHMLLAAYITSSFCVAATGAWHMLRGNFKAEAMIMLRMGLGLAAVLVPVQLFVGHLVGDYTHDMQPPKFAAIEARWHNEQPASEVLIAWPNVATQSNDFAISIPHLGSLIGSMSWTAEEVGIDSFPPDVRAPVVIPFFAFRIMVGCGVLMLVLAWYGTYQIARGRMEAKRWLLRAILLSFPLGFIAALTGWYTAEVGRQPWAVYNVLRTEDAVTPFLTWQHVIITIVLLTVVYGIVFTAGTVFIYRLLRRGPVEPSTPDDGAPSPKRPLAMPTDDAATGGRVRPDDGVLT